MKTLIRRSGNIKGILKKPKSKLSNTSIVEPPNVPQSVIPESWIWRLELGVIFASAALILFSGVMRSRMVHLEKICKDFISTKNVNSILARYEQSILNLGSMIDAKLKRMSDDIETGQNMTFFYKELLSNVTDNLTKFNNSINNIDYMRRIINDASVIISRECVDLMNFVTQEDKIIDNLTLRIQSLASDSQAMSGQMNTALNGVKQNAIPKNYYYLQLAGYPGPQQLWPEIQWQQLSFQFMLNAYLQISDENYFGRVSLSTPNLGDIEGNIAVDVSSVPSGYPPNLFYLLKPSPTGQYDLFPNISLFPFPQPKARKVKLWRRL